MSIEHLFRDGQELIELYIQEETKDMTTAIQESPLQVGTVVRVPLNDPGHLVGTIAELNPRHDEDGDFYGIKFEEDETIYYYCEYEIEVVTQELVEREWDEQPSQANTALTQWAVELASMPPLTSEDMAMVELYARAASAELGLEVLDE